MQWAEVLSADAFSAFEDAGLNNDKVFDVLHISVTARTCTHRIFSRTAVLISSNYPLQQAVKETGHRFRETVLALGGGKAPLQV